MQDVDRERVFRTTSRGSLLESQRLLENRRNESQVLNESPHVSDSLVVEPERERIPYNNSSTESILGNHSGSLSIPYP